MNGRILLRHLEGRVHVAERGGEDQLVAGARKLLDGTLGIRAFRDVLQVGRLDLVAESLRQALAADLVLIGPTHVADRAEIDEADLELVGRPFGAAGAGKGALNDRRSRKDSSRGGGSC